MRIVGSIDLQQSINTGDRKTSHQLPGGQTLELATQVGDGAHVSKTGVVRETVSVGMMMMRLMMMIVRLESGD